MNSVDLNDMFIKANKRAVLTYDSNIELEGNSWELAAVLCLMGVTGLTVTGAVISDADGISVQPPGKLAIKTRCVPGLLFPPRRMPLREFMDMIKV